MASQSDSQADQPKRTNKRTPASCSACRLRRSRCDRLWPCSECERRKSDCDYQGARAPAISARRRFRNAVECEEYIQHLEARLNTLEQPKRKREESAPALIDFVNEDLACHLSRVTLGPRVRSSNPRALETHTQALLAGLHTHPAPVFLPEPTFTLSLIPTGPAMPLDELQASLPAHAELTELAGYFFKSNKLFSQDIEPDSWPETLRICYEAHEPLKLSARDVHRLAGVFLVAAHGLILRAKVHQPGFGIKREEITRAHRWCNLALGALIQPDQGAILTQPSVWGIRAMALLGRIEISPEDFDNGAFFWNLTSSLAGSIGLFEEPPGFDAKEVGEVELESRRQLVWQIICFDWLGSSISGRLRPSIDPGHYAVNVPGKVACAMNPTDGWPLDPALAIRQACALTDRVMVSLTLLNQRPAPYDELLKVEQSLIEHMQKLPPRLQIIVSPDERSIQTEVALDPYQKMLCYTVWHRMLDLRIQVHRPFILLKQGIPDSERSRHLKELERACRIQFLLHDGLPSAYTLHPVVIYTHVNASVACALALAACPDVFDAKFFLPQLRKVVDFLRKGSQHPVASTLAQKARILLEKLMAQVKQLDNESQPASTRQYNPDFTVRANLEKSDTNQLKHKSLKPVSVVGCDPTPPGNTAQPFQPKGLEDHRIVRLRSLSPSCLAQAQKVGQEDPVDKAYETAETLLPSPEAPIDWSLMDAYQFTFSSPHLPLPGMSVADLGLDLSA